MLASFLWALGCIQGKDSSRRVLAVNLECERCQTRPSGVSMRRTDPLGL